MGDIKGEIINFLYKRRLDNMFGDGMEDDYIWNGVIIQGLNEMSDEELLEELEEGFDEENPDQETENLLGRVKLVYVCNECGSEDIHAAMWVNRNTNQVLDSTYLSMEGYFCIKCNKIHGIARKMKAC